MVRRCVRSQRRQKSPSTLAMCARSAASRRCAARPSASGSAAAAARLLLVARTSSPRPQLRPSAAPSAVCARCRTSEQDTNTQMVLLAAVLKPASPLALPTTQSLTANLNSFRLFFPSIDFFCLHLVFVFFCWLVLAFCLQSHVSGAEADQNIVARWWWFAGSTHRHTNE